MSSDVRCFVLDACTATTFARVNRLDVITTIPASRIVIAQRAQTEVRKEPAKAILAKAIAHGQVTVEAVDLAVPAEVAALVQFDGDERFRGRGEAEALALALARGYVVLTDEVAVWAVARKVITLAGTESCFMTTHLLRMAVRDKRLSLRDAVALFDTLDVAMGNRKHLTHLGYTIEDFLDS